MTPTPRLAILGVARQPGSEIMSQESRDRETHLECLVAAILTVGVLGKDGTAPKWAALRYAQVIQELRGRGGPVNPSLSTD